MGGGITAAVALIGGGLCYWKWDEWQIKKKLTGWWKWFKNLFTFSCCKGKPKPKKVTWKCPDGHENVTKNNPDKCPHSEKGKDKVCSKFNPASWWKCSKCQTNNKPNESGCTKQGCDVSRPTWKCSNSKCSHDNARIADQTACSFMFKGADGKETKCPGTRPEQILNPAAPAKWKCTNDTCTFENESTTTKCGGQIKGED